jgi:hypothetical protein
LGVAGQTLLGAGIISRIMPLLGLELLDMAYDDAAIPLRARVAQLCGVSR